LYTSPHLKDFRERIKINGQMMEKEFLVNFVEKTKAISEKIKPSFFELTFAMALDYFATKEVDVAVIETGLGGRLDSTNVITPLLSVITNISFDHMDILGDSLEKIAFEKAGIIKENVPVVVGESLSETRPVFEKKAVEMNAAISFADENFKIVSSEYEPENLKLTIQNIRRQEIVVFSLDLNGLYQEKNIVTVLAAVAILKNYFSLKKSKITEALEKVKKLTGLFGRWEIMHANPTVVLDVAHNEDGIRQLLLHISKLKYDQLHIIFGMVKDKEIKKVLGLFPKNATYYFTRAHNPRALPEKELQKEAGEFGITGETFSDVNMAVNEALAHASPGDLIVVCGSVFVIAEVESIK
jgi:dihydrofolate synthase/folylpolyglutamate synthase